MLFLREIVFRQDAEPEEEEEEEVVEEKQEEEEEEPGSPSFLAKLFGSGKKEKVWRTVEI